MKPDYTPFSISKAVLRKYLEEGEDAVVKWVERKFQIQNLTKDTPMYMYFDPVTERYYIVPIKVSWWFTFKRWILDKLGIKYELRQDGRD